MKYLKENVRLLEFNGCTGRVELCIEEITLDKLESILEYLPTPVRERFFRVLWGKDG
ncbi:MAG: hypothetical protein F7C32_03680 [Desulfurococcales archaeon]|nr:hypothetical protein [Desulfurococcales archaeon]